MIGTVAEIKTLRRHLHLKLPAPCTVVAVHPPRWGVPTTTVHSDIIAPKALLEESATDEEAGGAL